MHHDFFDKYKDVKSVWSEVKPLIRLLICISFIVSLSLIPLFNWFNIWFYFFIMLFIFFLSKLPELFFLKRTIIISIPAFIIALSASFVKENQFTWLMFIFAKAYLSIGVMVILISTTSFPFLITSLEKIKMPRLIISLLGFVYRYSFLFIDELESLERTYKSRTVSKSFKLKKIAISNIAATLFRISLERSEKVHQAMLSRGFTGSFKSISVEKISAAQVIVLIVFLILFIGVRIIV